jgi:superfamily II DNA or RNA helicase
MAALHLKSSNWVRQGVFTPPSSFAEFESRVNQIPEEKDRGDVFEIFIEGYLATQAMAQSRRHWIVGSIPIELRERYKLPNDGTGIDGIYEAHDGSHVAYQVKYRQRPNLTYQEVAPFLGLTEQFSDRVIFTNASTLAHQALPRTRWVSRQDFAALSTEALSEICGWITEKPATQCRAIPDLRYQTQVLEDIAKTLESNSRATVVMACGTGKTLVALWAVEQAKPKSVLVLLPSLSLVQQTVREWTRHTNLGSRFRFICVCSDDTVAGRRDSDALELDTADLGFRVDTDPATVNRFLSVSDGAVRVVFSTYQSSDVVSAGTKSLDPFDVAVFDEAHKTTGLAGGQFSRPLSDDHIRIRKRLFFTATPRHIDIRSKRDKDGEYKVQSMDDPAVYGPRAHTLSFKAAADKGVICPYKVVISVVDKQLIDDFTRKHGITLVDGDEVGTRWVSNLVALQQAIEQTGATKAITFHSRVNLAKDFASDGPRGIGHYLEGFEVRHVNGKQRSSDRGDLIQAFAAASKSIITNARCLTEGVDIPAVDMVAFIDPRQSRVDIAQAVGRAMRKPRGKSEKTVGYVFVPLFVGEEGETIEDAIKRERFDAVADVLNALQEHDEELVDLIRQLRQAKGEGKPFKPRITVEKIELIGPRVDLAQVVESVETRIADQLGSSWDEWYGKLSAYKQREGHTKVPQSYSTDDGAKLGIWVGDQRRRNEIISEDRRRRLDILGFIWNPWEERWALGFSELLEFFRINGHSRVSQEFVTSSGYSLGVWVNEQRKDENKLSSDRRSRLDSLGFIWDPFSNKWEIGFAELEKFVKREGHGNVALRFTTDSGYRLGNWVVNQRKNKNKLTPEQVTRLDGLGFCWDLREKLWETGYSELSAFVARVGHARVPNSHVTSTKYKLGAWVASQRLNFDQLSEDRRLRLEALQFSVDPLSETWERGFDAFADFFAAYGHAQVPANHKTDDGFKLGVWVQNQRRNRIALDERQRRRLDELGFVWEPFTALWEEGFSALQDYVAKHSHARVSANFITSDGFRLGAWVARQRANKETLETSRVRRLNTLGFIWDPLEGLWEEGFSELRTFVAREGHARVPQHYVTESGYKLGSWVSIQRGKKKRIAVSHKRALDDLGFVWDAFAEKWERGFSALQAFFNVEGHAKVPKYFIDSDGYKLGQWVSMQKQKIGRLPTARRRSLESLGLVSNTNTEDDE